MKLLRRIYVQRLAAGRIYFCRVLESHRATLAVTSEHGKWIVSDCPAQANRPIVQGTCLRALYWLARNQEIHPLDVALSDSTRYVTGFEEEPAEPAFADKEDSDDYCLL